MEEAKAYQGKGYCLQKPIYLNINNGDERNVHIHTQMGEKGEHNSSKTNTTPTRGLLTAIK